MTKASEPVKINLTEIEARHEAATEGPWSHDAESYGPGKTLWEITVTGDEEATVGEIWGEDNASLVAHARTDSPAMAAWIREAVSWIGNRRCDCFPCGYGGYTCKSCKARVSLLGRLGTSE